MDNTEDLKSKMEIELENTFREMFKSVPLIMLYDYASMIKRTADRVCGEYMEKGDAFRKEWALKTVRKMFGGDDVQKLEKDVEE